MMPKIRRKKKNDDIHLLLTDVVMPLMGGTELTNLFKALHPKAKVLLTSGYTDDAMIRYGVFRKGVNFMQKPFLPRLLAARVRETLDAVDSSAQSNE